jgi:hypothetical protein
LVDHIGSIAAGGIPYRTGSTITAAPRGVTDPRRIGNRYAGDRRSSRRKRFVDLGETYAVTPNPLPSAFDQVEIAGIDLRLR